MKRWRTMSILSLAVVLAGGCGQKPAVQSAESFASAAAPSSNIGTSAQANGNTSATTKQEVVSPETTTTEQPTKESTVEAKKVDAEASTKATPPSPDTAKSEMKNENKDQPAAMPKQKDKNPAQPAQAETSSKPETTAASPVSAPADEVKTKASTSSNGIDWSQFFDDDKQTTPSQRFWDLSGKTVQIKGFMGEVLSFEKHWFLLIPAPGAECPFDNGDETYWNKIMIVFVPDDIKLRYTSGPLKVTGKLDVGVKLDQSGYKTMFRLHDASFEKIKE